jgi:hypothetical protein
MTFNVENLFDNVDDPGKEDHTYLALTDKQSDEHKAACAEIEVARWREQCLDWDWSDNIIEQKLSIVADVILQADKGRGPDIVALQEIENIGILERLRTEYLAAAEYGPGILIEGDDLRGVDVAFLTRLELAGSPVLHRTDFSGAGKDRVYDTRGILEATFVRPDGTLLTGYSVHFPAPFHPTEMREAAYRHLNALRAALPPDRDAFAAGDFNTTSLEDRKKDMLGRLARPSWTVTHEVGCEGCKGTYYYAPGRSWRKRNMEFARGFGPDCERRTRPAAPRWHAVAFRDAGWCRRVGPLARGRNHRIQVETIPCFNIVTRFRPAAFGCRREYSGHSVFPYKPFIELAFLPE